MSASHTNLANKGWIQLSFLEQLANIGSEVSRTINWKGKDNQVLSQKAFGRALELLDLSISMQSDRARLKELTRLREAFVCFFRSENDIITSADSWRKEFYYYGLAARKQRQHHS